MKTLKELKEQYFTENPRLLGKYLLNTISQTSGCFKAFDTVSYDQISSKELEKAINTRKTDYARTQARFLIRELDFYSGCSHPIREEG